MVLSSMFNITFCRDII